MLHRKGLDSMAHCLVFLFFFWPLGFSLPFLLSLKYASHSHRFSCVPVAKSTNGATVPQHKKFMLTYPNVIRLPFDRLCDLVLIVYKVPERCDRCLQHRALVLGTARTTDGLS